MYFCYGADVLICFVQVYCLGTLLSMQISFVGFQPVQSSEHMAVSNLLFLTLNSVICE